LNDVTETPLQEQHRLSRDLRALAHDAEVLLRHAADDAGEGYAEARARLEESVARAKGRLECADTALRGRVREAGTAVDHYVHEKPWRSICTAAGAGLLAGVLLMRR